LILPEINLLFFLQLFHLLYLSPGGLAPRREVQVVTGICIRGVAYASSCLPGTGRRQKLFGLTHWPKKANASAFTARHHLWNGSQGRFWACCLKLHTCSSSGEHLPKAGSFPEHPSPQEMQRDFKSLRKTDFGRVSSIITNSFSLIL